MPRYYSWVSGWLHALGRQTGELEVGVVQRPPITLGGNAMRGVIGGPECAGLATAEATQIVSSGPSRTIDYRAERGPA